MFNCDEKSHLNTLLTIILFTICSDPNFFKNVATVFT